MIELRIRGRIEKFIDPIGGFFARVGFTPTWLTAMGLGLTLVGAFLVANTMFISGAIVALAGSALDGLDGSVARARGTASASGALLDSVADRMGETGMWAGLTFALAETPRLTFLCVVSVAGALLVSYIRAKAESMGISGKGGLMGRAERVILLTIGLLAFDYIEPVLWLMVILTWITVFQRFYGAVDPARAWILTGNTSSTEACRRCWDASPNR